MAILAFNNNPFFVTKVNIISLFMEFDMATIASLYKDKTSIYHLPKEKFNFLTRKRLYNRVLNKKTIFLDLKYWVGFRMALNGENMNNPTQNDQLKKIYKKLRELINNGKVECLLSSSIIDELGKQAIDRRIETARIIDGLGCNIVLNNLNVCLQELLNLYSLEEGKATQKEFHLSSIFESNPFLCRSILSKSSGPDFIDNIIFEELLTQSLEEYLVATDSKSQNSSEKFASIFNDLKASSKGKYDYKTFLVDGLKEQFKSIEEMFNLKLETNIAIEERLEIIIANAPFQYLLSAIHAAMGIDNDRKIKSNDYFDLNHSCIGVGYADFFFTEKNFHHLLNSNPINYHSHFSVRIYSKNEDILEVLNTI